MRQRRAPRSRRALVRSDDALRRFGLQLIRLDVAPADPRALRWRLLAFSAAQPATADADAPGITATSALAVCVHTLALWASVRRPVHRLQGAGLAVRCLACRSITGAGTRSSAARRRARPSQTSADAQTCTSASSPPSCPLCTPARCAPPCCTVTRSTGNAEHGGSTPACAAQSAALAHILTHAPHAPTRTNMHARHPSLRVPLARHGRSTVSARSAGAALLRAGAPTLGMLRRLYALLYA